MPRHKPLAPELVLLRTKLSMPAPCPALVPRPRLVAQLAQAERHALTVLAAPAGFGKTTLVTEWYTAAAPAHLAWLTLDNGDDSPHQFLNYLCAAFETVSLPLGRATRALLSSSAPPQVVLTALLNSFHAWREPVFLVLDDYHTLSSPDVIALVAFVVEHCPPVLHLILLSRSDPHLPLARYRVRGQLNELRAADLRFTLEEATQFLNQAMGLGLSPVHIAALAERTEGWIAGLQMAALSMRGRTDIDRFVRAFTGSHRFILDYLVDQVLAEQPPELEAFMLQTSILERLTSDLAAAVTERADSQALLYELEQRNLFLVPLDDERHWFRYHQLFAQVLQHRLRAAFPAEVPALYRRAAAWHEEQGLLTQAIDYSLAGQDLERASRILEQAGTKFALGGQVHQVMTWLNMLPPPTVHTRPLLATTAAIGSMITDELAAAEGFLRDAQAHLEAATPEQRPIIHGWSAILRGEAALRVGDLAQCIEISRQGLAELAESEPARLPLLVRVAREYELTGDVTHTAEQRIAATIAPVRASGNLFTLLNSITHLARIRVLRGHLQQGMATYNLAEQAMPFVPGQRVHVIHPGYYFGVADILRELNRLPEAAEQAAHGMELTRGSLSVDADVLTLGYAVLARVHCALGDFESALAMLDEFAERAAARQFIVELVAQVTALRALIELQRNNLAAAVQWADASGISPNTPPNFFREPEYLTWARVRTAQAQSRLYPAEQVIAFLTRLRADAQANERISSVIEILVLMALANSAAENWAAASLALSDALSLAAPEGYLRVFLDAGPVLAEILKGLARQAAPPIQPYLHRLLTAFGISIPLPLSIVHSPNTPDDLSAREIQVLELVAQGASNQEIAARLIVAVGTVKKHINNIYSKLGVNSRTQAVARGRARKLIP